MEKKITGFKTKGMNRDLSVSAFNPEFSFENHNIRLSTAESNTQMSWVNEKGTHETEFIVWTQENPIYWEDENSLPLQGHIEGFPVGTAVVNDKLAVFTTMNVNSAVEAARLTALKTQQENLKSAYDGEISLKERLIEGYNTAIGNLRVDIAGAQANIATVEANMAAYGKDPNEDSYIAYGREEDNDPFSDTLTDLTGLMWEHPLLWDETCLFEGQYITNENAINIYYNVSASSTVEEKKRGLEALKAALHSLKSWIPYYQNTDLEKYIKLLEQGKNNTDTVVCFGVLRLLLDIERDTTYQGYKDYKAEQEAIIAEKQNQIEEDERKIAQLNTEIAALTAQSDTCAQKIADYTAQIEALPAEIHQDCIYLIKGTDTPYSYKCICLYRGDLNLDKDHPLETLVSYESEKIQKVYWIDGKNPLRVINVALTKATEVTNYSPTSFDNILTLKLEETVTVTRSYTSGMFLSGVIQYCFTYNNKFAQESNIFYTTPLIYIANEDRGGAPDERIQNAFKIAIVDYDTSFDYIIIYAIHRSSLNATPSCRRVAKIEVPSVVGRTITYTDTGTAGESIDPTELLYKNLPTAIFKTMTQKDNTLFLGGITLLQEENINNVLPSDWNISIAESYRTLVFPKSPSVKGTYPYVNQLREIEPCCGFRQGNYYRLGVQFQDTRGYWSEPVFIEDKQVTNAAKYSDSYNDRLSAHVYSLEQRTFTGTIEVSLGQTLYNAGYRKVRALVVFPEINERVSVCKGASVPTLYTNNLINQNNILGYPSWVFRDHDKIRYMEDLETAYRQIDWSTLDSAYFAETCEIEGRYADGDKFKINWGIRSLHTPDIIHEEELVHNITSNNIQAYKVGVYSWNHCMSHAEGQAESATIDSYASGFLVQNRVDLRPASGYSYIWGMQPLRSGYWYKDSPVDDESATSYIPSGVGNKWYLVYMWESKRSYNNDNFQRDGASAVIQEKKISNLLFANITMDSSKRDLHSYEGTSPNRREITDIQVFNQDDLQTIIYDGKFYQGNLDTALMPNEDEYFYCLWDYENPSDPTYDPSTRMWNYGKIAVTNSDNNWVEYPNTSTVLDTRWPIGDHDAALKKRRIPVRLTYKSTPHILYPGGGTYNNGDWEVSQWTGDNQLRMIVELKRNVNPSTLFGGTSEEALQANTWIPCGKAVKISTTGNTTYEYTYGDSYYQRYDILKTYPYSRDDLNQVTEIMSIPLETYVNVDGRYDRNRGLTDNTNIAPQNFNLVNPVYSQRDNFFSYKIISETTDTNIFPNQITWSKTKQSGEDIDTWTQLTLASILELDGDKGTITKLERLGDQIIAFQDKGISQIQYNENIQIASTEGVPIEIANSEKVRGKRYISNTVGCSNKWSVCPTSAGIYFMDSNEKAIYLLNDKLENLSLKGGMLAWCKQNIPEPSVAWAPYDFNNFVSYYDKVNQEVLFINKDTALAWSEKFGVFTSFYNYNSIPYFNMLEDKGIWLKPYEGIIDSAKVQCTGLWEHNEGDYCSFFEENKPYSITFVGNPEPQLDKIFANLEFRAEVTGDGSYDSGTDKFTPYLPFDSLEVWNPYQHGIQDLANRSSTSLSQALNATSEVLKRTYRIWRCDIPRDNYPVLTAPTAPVEPVDPTSEQQEAYEQDYAEYQEALAEYNAYLQEAEDKGITRFNKHPIDRMRNPWLYMKLEKEAVASGSTVPKCELHDMQMIYYV